MTTCAARLRASQLTRLAFWVFTQPRPGATGRSTLSNVSLWQFTTRPRARAHLETFVPNSHLQLEMVRTQAPVGLEQTRSLTRFAAVSVRSHFADVGLLGYEVVLSCGRHRHVSTHISVFGRGD